VVLRKLIEERVPVRELRTILQAVAECGLEGETLDLSVSRDQLDQGRKQLPQMLAAVRIALRRVISKSVTAADWRLSAIALNPEVDQLLSRVATGGVPLSPELSERLVAACREGVGTAQVILAGCSARPQLAALLGEAKLDLQVLAYEELSEEVELEICKAIGFELPEADSEKVVSLRRAA
jgi:flagellar biosynthesis protein FlhA